MGGFLGRLFSSPGVHTLPLKTETEGYMPFRFCFYIILYDISNVSYNSGWLLIILLFRR